MGTDKKTDMVEVRFIYSIVAFKRKVGGEDLYTTNKCVVEATHYERAGHRILIQNVDTYNNIGRITEYFASMAVTYAKKAICRKLKIKRSEVKKILSVQVVYKTSVINIVEYIKD
jgi:enolase